MHNCKTARSGFIDLALDEVSPARSKQLLAELNACPECREEYAAVRSTLHVSTQALRSGVADESFWPGYHQRLRHALVASSTRETLNVLGNDSGRSQPAKTSNGAWLALRGMLATSVRIPVPAALALMVLFAISVVGLRSQGQVTTIPATPIVAVETRTVTVPVVQEKVITRVVYLPEKTRRSRRPGLDRNTPSSLGSTVASTTPGASRQGALNLAGFEPTDTVRLTVIKGSYRDEK
jgi:anti-sigma factor RsiW